MNNQSDVNYVQLMYEESTRPSVLHFQSGLKLLYTFPLKLYIS